VDPKRFDAISRELANGVSRRRALGLLVWSFVGIVTGGLFRSRPVQAAPVTCTPQLCLVQADNRFEQRKTLCLHIHIPPIRERCILIAERRRHAERLACDLCPAGTRCDRDTCCGAAVAGCWGTCCPPGKECCDEACIEPKCQECHLDSVTNQIVRRLPCTQPPICPMLNDSLQYPELFFYLLNHRYKLLNEPETLVTQVDGTL
jgi:hypothetical protein